MASSAHAYLCTGSEADIPAAVAALRGAGAEPSEVTIRSFDSLGVDDAREIRERAILRGSGLRLFVIAALSMTSEAQNALLKTLEEPSAHAIFLIVTPSPHTLLPTLRSRVQLLTYAHEATGSPVSIEAFLASSPEKRIELLKPLTHADEKDTAGVLAFLGALEHALRVGANGTALASVYSARRYLLDKGALRKALLEQLAFTMP